MAKRMPTLPDRLARFIAAQPLFFVATAPAGGGGHVNLSPKGMDSLRVLAPDRVAWLSVTGSGNETAAHVLDNGRMTLMWTAFAGPPLILRVYGRARVVYPGDAAWPDLAVDLVQTSCGMSIPLLDHVGERDALTQWAEAKGADGLADYWAERNAVSLDGLATGIAATRA